MLVLSYPSPHMYPNHRSWEQWLGKRVDRCRWYTYLGLLLYRIHSQILALPSFRGKNAIYDKLHLMRLLFPCLFRYSPSYSLPLLTSVPKPVDL